MNVKKFFLSMIITVLVIATLIGGLNVGKLLFDTNLSSEIEKYLDKVSSSKENILLMGVDKEGLHADVIMLVSLDSKEKTIRVLSIPRDTRVEYSGGRYDKINHALAYENGEEKVISLVKQITGMPIHYYCEVNFEGFRNVIDILGGVEFDVPEDMHYEDPAQDLYIHVNKGLQLLDGKDAEGVVRFRATYVEGDTKRIGVQQDFLRALFKQKLKPEYLRKAPALIEEMYEHVTTNFSVADATKYIKTLKKMDENSLKTFTLPGEGKYVGPVSYFVYDAPATRKLLLEEFGYPEDEAREWRKQKEAEAAALE